MITLLRHAVVLFLVFATTSLAGPGAHASDLGLEIGLSKRTYILHEPIWLDVTLTNNTSDSLRTQTLASPNHREFSIVVRTLNGDTLPYTGLHHDIAGGPGGLLLEGGGQEYGVFDLAEYFSPYDRGSGHSVSNWIFPYIPVGSYTVQVYFEEAISNELAFDIVEPSGEERMVLGLIEEAFSVWSNSDASPSVQRFRSIAERYPNSAFAAQCYCFSERYSPTTYEATRQGTHDKRFSRREWLLKYPNSGKTKAWLWTATLGLDDDEKIELYNSLIEEKANTRVSRFARQERDKILQKQRIERESR